jgi:hypothetical protein
MLVALLLVVAAGSALAMPPDPIDPPPIIEPEDEYPVPDNGFDWAMPSRYGLYENGIVDFHWIGADDLSGGHYDETHVNPSEFIVFFDGCRSWEDEESGASEMTYTWTIDGQVTSGHACRIQHGFDTQGTFTATLTIIQVDGTVLLDDQGRGNPFTQSIVVKDFLIVSIGDSYASGEGNPDRWLQPTGSDIFGQPTGATPPVWQDKRCHRSANAAPALAALMLEMADPHTSVTFLSFACSSATINTHTFDDAPIWDPYRRYPQYPLVKDRGTGVLDPGCGQEPPDGERPQDNQLPSQIDQVVAALTNKGTVPARPVDALLISAGGNDMGFVPIIQLCALYWECETDVLVTCQDGEGLCDLQTRAADDVNALPAKYDALAADIEEYIPFTPNGRVYITQYPDPTRDSSGAHCDEMLTDIIPWWVSAGSTVWGAWDTVFGSAYTVPLPPNRWDLDEATWAGDVVGPALNNKIAAAAETHDWVLVDGINDSTGNLFATHGYCAADNWIRTATESVDIQGPWTYWRLPFGAWPAASVKTTGTMHPTTAGNMAVAQRIMAKMGPILLPGDEPAMAPAFTSTSNNAIVSTSGWFTGHEAGATCPAGAADCSFAQVVATSAADTTISGASLVVDGVPVACSPTGVTAGGLTCQAELTTPQSYTWSLAFAADGVYQLAFSASSTNGASATFSRQVKVDLTNPVASHELSAPPVTSEWYLIPVTITLTAADGTGSGPAALEYELDGQAFVTDGNGAVVTIDTTGVHNLTYRAVDNAGRTSPWQTLSVTAVDADAFTPAAFAGGPYEGLPENAITLAGSGIDPRGESLTFSWDLDGDEIFETAGSTAPFTSPAGQNRDIPVWFRACNTSGFCGTALTFVRVREPGAGFAWGLDFSGQSTVPDGLDNVIAIDGSVEHSLALKADGTVVAWGNDTWQGHVPDGLSGVTAISAGGDHNLALKNDGTVVAWGDNSYHQCSVPSHLSNFIAIAAGGTHSVALRDDGTVVAWGDNEYGQTDVPDSLDNVQVIAISAGRDHTLALTADGTVVAWGNNGYHQSRVPEGLHNVIAIAAGTVSSLALKADGTVVAWGFNEGGGTDVPEGLDHVIAIAGGFGWGLALKDDGTIVHWGLDQSGHGDSLVPTGLSDVKAIACGYYHGLALIGENTPPVVTAQPEDQTVVAGDTVSFGAAASGDPAPGLQWQVSTDGGATWTDVASATASPLTFTASLEQNGNQYHAVFTNSAGSATSDAATLTVGKIAAAVTLADLTQTYDGQPKPVTVSTDPAGLAVNVTYLDGSSVAPIAAGSYTVVATVDDAVYEGSASGTLTIEPKPVTVTADAKSKVAGEPDPTLTHQITAGSLAFDDVFSGALTREPGEAVGAYAILQGTLALNSNYTLTYVGANLTITDASPPTITLTTRADWEAGALSIQGSVPGAAYSGAVNVYNDYGDRPGKVEFKVDTGANLGRTNGAGDDGVASEAFAFKFKGYNRAQPWQNTVPFAFGTKGGRDALWTPQFFNAGILVVHMAQFSTDNGAGDEDATVGVIERGDFRAIDGDFGASFKCNRPGKVCFQKWNGTSWQQIGRTNGPGDDGNLISFTVLTVRTGYTLDGAGKIVNTNKSVPIAQINGVKYGKHLGLQTPNYGNNIGTQSMLLLPKLP